MTSAIKQTVENCQACQVYQHRNPNTEVEAHERPEEPWTKVALDLFQLNGRHYILVVDYTSKYPEVHRLEDLTSKHIIIGLKSIFARHGIPIMVVSDNDPKISGMEMRNFYNSWGITLNTSSPYYPQSNGMAERAIQTIKRLLKKAFLVDDDPYLSLLAYRATSVDGAESPAEILFNRKLRTTIPNYAKETIMEYIKPQSHTRHNLGDAVDFYNEKTKRFDRQGVIVANSAPKSVVIRDERSKQYRRNERDVRKATTSIPARLAANQSDPIESITNHLTETKDQPVRIEEPDKTQQEETEDPIQPQLPSGEDEEQVETGRRSRSGRAIQKPLRYR